MYWVLQCSVVWCITCLAEGPGESAASSRKSNRQESDFAGHVNASTGSSFHFVVAKARTLLWTSLAALYWERPSCITGLAGALCTATVLSLSSLLLFFFCFIVSSLVLFSVKLSESGTACLLPSSLLSLYPFFGQRFDATLSRICSATVSLRACSCTYSGLGIQIKGRIRVHFA